ncbi:MAG: 3-deoxy-D-manno-octulosonic acid transferase [Phycisphaerales bacterium]
MLHLVRDCVYAVGGPLLILARRVRGKRSSSITGRFGSIRVPRRDPARPRILIHAVSLGEVNSIPAFVQALLAREPEPEIIIAAATDTGLARALALFEKKHVVVRCPLDFSRSVARYLNAISPDVVVLIEQEIWPNFVRACAKRGIPVAVVSGRLSDRSARRYAKFGWLMQATLSKLAHVAVQDETFAKRFIAAGVPAARVSVTGSMKWDNIATDMHLPSASDALATALGIDRSRPLIVAGSTEPAEHPLLHNACPQGVQLLCAPRRPEWAEQAARDLPGCAMRSRGTIGNATDRFLLDTTGELNAAYALADVAVVGRSFGELFGSNPIEPIAHGKATVIGQRTSDFEWCVPTLVAAGGLVQTNVEHVAAELNALIHDPARCAAIAERGLATIKAMQGASRRNADLVCGLVQTIQNRCG